MAQKSSTILSVGLFLILAAALPLIAQDDGQSDSPYAKIDHISINTPKSAEKSAKHLAQYLLQYTHTDAEKARAVYRWITHNIRYDYEAYFSGRLRDTNIDTDDVFRLRLTVCDGYASLFEEIGTLMGLVVVKVYGYVDSPRYPILQYGGSPNHAWNAVRIDRKWQLVDATWGAGYIDSRTGLFVPDFNERYFLTPPEDFIRTHFPVDPKWQGLPKPLTIQEYQEQIYRGWRFEK